MAGANEANLLPNLRQREPPAWERSLLPEKCPSEVAPSQTTPRRCTLPCRAGEVDPSSFHFSAHADAGRETPTLTRWFSARSPDRGLQVLLVLFPIRRRLRRLDIGPGKDRRRYAAESHGDPSVPRGGEVQTRDAGQNIDTDRLDADLKEHFGLGQIGRYDAGDRRPECL